MRNDLIQPNQRRGSLAHVDLLLLPCEQVRNAVWTGASVEAHHWVRAWAMEARQLHISRLKTCKNLGGAYEVPALRETWAASLLGFRR